MWNARLSEPTYTDGLDPLVGSCGPEREMRALESARAGWASVSKVLALVVHSADPRERLHRAVAGLGLLPIVEHCGIRARPSETPHSLACPFGPVDASRWVVVQLHPQADPHDVGVVQDLLALCAELYAQALQHEQLRTQALTDPLTGLWNRRGLAPLLDQALARWTRHGAGLAVLAIDVDHFKSVNDEHGHDAGDRALVLIGRCIQACTRPTDIVARTGGDELVVLLSDTDLAGARELADRIQCELASVKGSSLPSLSVSIGLSDVSHIDPHCELSFDQQLLASADRALYAAKRRGRGRWEQDPQRERPPLRLGAQ